MERDQLLELEIWVKEQLEILMGKLTKDEQDFAGNMFFTGEFNGPWTRINRHNEVGIIMQD